MIYVLLLVLSLPVSSLWMISRSSDDAVNSSGWKSLLLVIASPRFLGLWYAVVNCSIYNSLLRISEQVEL